MYEEGYYYGRCVIAVFVANKYEGYTVKCVGVLNTNEQTATIASGKCTFTVPGRDEYTIRLYNSDNEIISSISEVCNYGEYHKVTLGVVEGTVGGIKAAIESGNPENYYSPGDQVKFKEYGTDAVFDVIHVNYQESTYGKNIIFGRHDALPETKQCQKTNTNLYGYKRTLLASYLDNDYYDGLSSELKDSIRTFTFYTTQGNKVNTNQAETHKIWIPTEWNIFGARNYAGTAEQNASPAPVQFSYFGNNNNGRRVKRIGKDNVGWFLSSPLIDSNGGFCGVDSTGASMHFGAAARLGAVPFFMIAATSDSE